MERGGAGRALIMYARGSTHYVCEVERSVGMQEGEQGGAWCRRVPLGAAEG